MMDGDIRNLRASYKEEKRLLSQHGYKIVMRALKQNYQRVDLDRDQK